MGQGHKDAGEGLVVTRVEVVRAIREKLQT